MEEHHAGTNPSTVRTLRVLQLAHPRREVGRQAGVWHYRTAVTAIPPKAGMMLHCGI